MLKRREIEARIVAPLVDALGAEFGRERVVQIVRDTIIRIAREQGAQRAAATGDNSLTTFAGTGSAWRQGNALEIDVLAQDDGRYEYNVTRCRYAEMYRALGIPELGFMLSCNRDFSLIEGFNPDVELTRTQTIMQGGTFCDFRYKLAQAARKP
ncbi:MAG: L-2-amino-thiazoline-4-carboxylic acid hydrolase [Chloroflexi bacterium]|nr:L-2-amino-thiazoline-4-carboxylic acid hydrolase [Chloroflexota bacterium]